MKRQMREENDETNIYACIYDTIDKNSVSGTHGDYSVSNLWPHLSRVSLNALSMWLAFHVSLCRTLDVSLSLLFLSTAAAGGGDIFLF